MSEKKNLVLNPHLSVRFNDIPPWIKTEQANHLVWLGERAFRAYNKLDGSWGRWAEWEAASREFHNYRYTLGL